MCDLSTYLTVIFLTILSIVWVGGIVFFGIHSKAWRSPFIVTPLVMVWPFIVLGFLVESFLEYAKNLKNDF